MTPIVRVPTNLPPQILRLMDTGAQGLHVPWINSAAEADAAVRSVKYHPRGQRGLAGVRAADYGQAGSLADYTQRTPLWRADFMPYGGFKGSGIGKEGPRYAIEEMTELKTVVIHGLS